MRILQTHADWIEFEPLKKEIKQAEEIEKKKQEFKDIVVLFTSIESGDTEAVARKAIGDVKEFLGKIKINKILIYPFAHLSQDLAKPDVAMKILSAMEAEANKNEIEVHRAPFGWNKKLSISVKGHPLAEQSRVYGGSETTVKKKIHHHEDRGKITLDRRNLPPNDHRILGEELGIFYFSEDVGAGLPLWLPNGETLKNLLINFMRRIEEKYGYKYVSTPHIARGAIFEKTGHLPYYKDSMYAPIEIEGDEYYLKPMNCPHHHMIFSKIVESYRNLPLRLAEAGMTYRFELSGVTYGLIRVKCFTQNDSHIYVTPSQLKEEFGRVLDLFKEVYEVMGIKDYWFRLSLPDFKNNPEKYTGDPKEWGYACDEIRKVMQESGMKFVEESGEAAFYGPKIDVQIKNALGKEETIATSQVDIVVPKRLGLFYIDDKGEKKIPIVIHRAILGSYERFIAYLLEQTEGKLPVWLAPVQVRVLPITDGNKDYAHTVLGKLRKNGIRAEIDEESRTIQYKIRDAQLKKIPLMVIVGGKEEEKGTIAVRNRDSGKTEYDLQPQDLIDRIEEDVKNYK